MAATLTNSAGKPDQGAGVGVLFRSKSVVTIVRYMTSRRLARVRVSTLEQELHRQANVSRGAVSNALQILEEASLIRRQKDAGVLICEIRFPALWTKLGELFDAEVQPETPTKGLPWLPGLVADTPRRQGFRHQPASTDVEVPLEAVEAMLATLPEAEPVTSTRRSSAPGRRR